MQDSPNFLWCLDNEVSAEQLREYLAALEDQTTSTLYAWTQLLTKQVPILPRAYLSSTFCEAKPGSIPDGFTVQLSEVISRFERLMHAKLGGAQRPLILTIEGDYCGSIRNIGVSPRSLRALVHRHGEARAFTLYVDFLESFSTHVLGCPHIDFRRTFGLASGRDTEGQRLEKLPEHEFLKLVERYQNLVVQKTHKPFPESPERQLLSAIIRLAWIAKESGGDSIFLSVQAYPSVYGRSMHGVAFTRNPFSGEKSVYGVYQTGGEEKKRPLTAGPGDVESETLRATSADTYAVLRQHLPTIEEVFRDVTEAQFLTDEEGNLYFTDFCKAQTSAKTSVVAAVEFCTRGLITETEAVSRLDPGDIEVLLHPTLDDESRKQLEPVDGEGVTAAPGTGVGTLFFRMADAIEFIKRHGAKSRPKVLLATDELLITDSAGVPLLAGIVTRAGGIASHAAVMARANGIPCIVGFKGMEIASDGGSARFGESTIKKGTVVTMEAGGTGRLHLGEGKLQNLSFQTGLVKELSQLLRTAAQQARIPLSIYVNINNAQDAETGLVFGAEGVGLCRTENMFLEPEALDNIRHVIFSDSAEKCRKELQALEELQFRDFSRIFKALGKRPINIRLMDLPLHEFVPPGRTEMDRVLSSIPPEEREACRARAESLREHNPMLGLRACRFGLLMPEVYDMQLRAIVRAAYAVAESGAEVDPGIMFPLVITAEELKKLRERVWRIEESVRRSGKFSIPAALKFRVGTMIEVPAAALQADKLARLGEFFAFGTNDLTQTTMGISRDDGTRFLPHYLEQGLLEDDPFRVLSEPVRELVEGAVARGRRARPDAVFGICGEQGGDRSTLELCLENGIDYVSCSPFRVLSTRLSLLHLAPAMAERWARESPAPAGRARRTETEKRDEPRATARA